MSALTYRLNLALDRSEGTLAITDDTSGRSYVEPLPEGGLPYLLSLEEDPGESAEIRARVLQETRSPAFEASRTTDCRILVLQTYINESSLAQDDDASYVIRIKNTATHYLAREICLKASLVPETSPTLPGGAPAVGSTQPGGALFVELLPPDQHIRDLEPGEERELTFVVLTRGTVPGSYSVHFELTYDVLYWDCRPARSEGTGTFVVDAPVPKPMRAATGSRHRP